MRTIILIWLALSASVNFVGAQNTQIELNQGLIVGLKIFPEASKLPVYSFLGVPYAEPPVGELRFLLPQSHSGWNRTYFARQFRANCLQLENSIYDEAPENSPPHKQPEMSEDCLFLNLWVPETGIRAKSPSLPVLVIITGEEMTFDWYQNRPTGLDLAAEGVIVVTIQYRMNIFGWLGVNSNKIPGNFALHDQQLAMTWVQQNIHKFGGNPEQVTLLGHGTTGSLCALFHLLSPQTEQLFSKLIYMSGGNVATNTSRLKNSKISEKVIEKLGCQFERNLVIDCLQSKSSHDLLKAFESIYRNGNLSSRLGPMTDTFRKWDQQYVPLDIKTYLNSGRIRKIPMMLGITSNEGAFIRDFWIDLARKGYSPLRAYINNTIVPSILNRYVDEKDVNGKMFKLINWRYLETASSPAHLLNSLQRLISEAEYESPFFNLIELIARAMVPQLFVYSFDMSKSMDMRGKINLFGGASHSSELPLLLGPSLYQQIARRRFTPYEDKICKKLRSYFLEFIKNGAPVSSGRAFDGWQPFTVNKKFIKKLGDSDDNDVPRSIFEENLEEIEKNLEKDYGLRPPSYSNQVSSYREVAGDFQTKKSSYSVNRIDYTAHKKLKEIYSFWNILIPSMITMNNKTNSSSEQLLMLASSYETIKYKNAFFSMLTVVIFLLILLGICIYLVQKYHPRLQFHTHL
ncbi:hypothetical protein ACFFRR_007718 [Megaselia abdita]